MSMCNVYCVCGYCHQYEIVKKSKLLLLPHLLFTLLLKITVQEQQGMHIDELKPVSKRRRLLLKHRVESEPQEAVRTEVNAYTYRRRLVMTLTMIG